jgi:predicted nucleotidyltransferase
MTPLEKTILATLSYHDIFDYPLTAFELWRFAVRSPQLALGAGLGEYLAALSESAVLREKVGEKYGFYFLLGREELVEKRLRRKKLADLKWKKARRIFRLLSGVPFVRGVFVSGSLALENSREESDVDVIVVARAGRIWTVRTFMTVLTFLLGVRRYGTRTRDRICLNHYITDKSLRIPFESLYNAQSYAHLVNVYAQDEAVFQRFQEENAWLGKYVANYRPAELPSNRTLRRDRFLAALARAGEVLLGGALGGWLEKLFSRWEGRRIRRDPLARKSGGRITIDDTQLEFHPQSHEAFVIPEFNSRMEALGLGEFSGQKNSGLNK